MNPPPRQPLSLRKKVLFALAPLLILLAAIEIGTRFWYYQLKSGYPLALLHVFDRAAKKVTDFRLKIALGKFQAERPADPDKHARDFFNADSMKETREKFFARYETIFRDFQRLCAEADARLVLLYIPSTEFSRNTSRAFFSALAEKTQTPLLDLTDTFARYSSTTVYLLPRNAHLSRFGNQIVADELLRFLEPHLAHRSKVAYSQRPRRLGDLRPNHDAIWPMDPEMPYRVVTNSQGLRRNSDLPFPRPRDKTRILCIGDSFTFGPYLNGLDCYPQLAESRGRNVEVINAGISGYTLCDEYSYFEERGRFIEPDIVVLQVLDNDLYGFFPYVMRQFCRGGKYCIGRGLQ